MLGQKGAITVSKEPSVMEQIFGDLAPKLVDLSDNLLLGDIMAFYSGWPSAMSALALAKEQFSKDK